MTLLAVAIGGATGACLRATLQRWLEADFPHVIYVVNALGSFLLGWIYAALPETHHPLLINGLCGALTTYSTFAVAALDLLSQGRRLAGLAHIALNLGGSLLAVAAGLSLA